MTSRWADELAFTEDLSRRAGALLTESYERLEHIDYKSKRDVVTNADYASEQLVIDAIKARYPDDAILAEESGEHAGVRRDDGSHNGRTWVIDPLDGTVNYANGIPYYCVSIGLVVDDVPTVGVIFDPARNDLYSATVDGPAMLDGEPITASVEGGALRLRREPGGHRSRRPGARAADRAVDPHPSAHGQCRPCPRVRGERSLRRLHPERRALAVGRGRRGAHRGALRGRRDRCRGDAWWNPKLRGPRTSVVAAPSAQHRALLELLASLKTRQQTRR